MINIRFSEKLSTIFLFSISNEEKKITIPVSFRFIGSLNTKQYRITLKHNLSLDFGDKTGFDNYLIDLY